MRRRPARSSPRARSCPSEPGDPVTVVASGCDGTPKVLVDVDLFRPDLILLDWFLADTTADTVLERLQARENVVPVIILSARDHEARRLPQKDRQGLVDCLPKPIGPQALLRALSDAGFPPRLS